MKYDSIIFDIDGTLWDASEATAKGWNAGLKKLGIDKNITSKQVKSVTGHPNEVCIEILLSGLQQQYSNLQNTLDEFEIEQIKSDGGKFYTGVIESIKELSKDRRMFLVSNCQDWYMDLFLELSGLEDNITAFDCYGLSGKPKNKMLTKMMNEYSLKNPVYIGDTQGDKEATKMAGMNFIYAAYGFGSLDTYKEKADTFTELINLLKE